ncbi:uncharacterized protein [Medicago truncatula]|uniref:uncharacterized protein n=1 Tax=Medicago truncatula TaxID=3880 RepID=UPI000D2F46D3|nr:uncharacterized protein LOC25484715 [Medicago truncatula]
MSAQKGSMDSGNTRKRMKPEVQEKTRDEAESQIVLVQEEGFETNQIGSEEMELNVSLVLEKIENFTQRVSELLESGKTMLKELCNEFEEKLIMRVMKLPLNIQS